MKTTYVTLRGRSIATLLALRHRTTRAYGRRQPTTAAARRLLVRLADLDAAIAAAFEPARL